MEGSFEELQGGATNLELQLVTNCGNINNYKSGNFGNCWLQNWLVKRDNESLLLNMLQSL